MKNQAVQSYKILIQILLLFIILVGGIIPFISSAQQSDNLLQFNHSLPKAEGSVRQASATINTDYLLTNLSSKSTYQLQLFPDTAFSIRLNPPSQPNRNSYLYSGRTTDSNIDNVSLTIVKDDYVLAIHTTNTAFRYVISGKLYTPLATVKEIQQAKLKCQTAETNTSRMQPRSFAPRVARNDLSTLLPTQKAYIDLMLVYDNKAQTWLDNNYNGNKLLFKNQLEQHFNQVMTNSKLNIQFNIVHQMDIDDSTFVHSTQLNSLHSSSTANNKAIRTARNQHYADLVLYFTHAADSNFGAANYGIADLLTQPTGNPEAAYSISNIAHALGQAVIHELGHNFGAAHASTQPHEPGPNPAFGNYAAGWYFNNYHTLMAYQENNSQVAMIFSSPDLNYNDLTPGNINLGDNRRVLIQTAPYVSAYLQNPIPSDGTAPISLHEALDNNELTFSTGGDTPWFGQPLTYHYGNSAAQAQLFQKDQSNWLQTSVTGPGILYFKAKAKLHTNSSYTSDQFHLLINGKQQRNLDTSTSDFLSYAVPIASGTHSVKWQLSNLSGSTYTKGWIDEVSFTSSPVVSTTDALDNDYLALVLSGIRWQTPPLETPWIAQNMFTSDGVDALQASDFYIDEGYSMSPYNLGISSAINSPDGGTLTFSWATSVSNSKDSDNRCQRGFSFQLDNEQPIRLCGETPFQTQRIPIPAGFHFVNWSFGGDFANTSRYNTGWIDDIQFTPSVTNDVVGLGIYNAWDHGGTVGCDKQDNIPKGTSVNCQATPDDGYEFKAWRGVCAEETTENCTFIINRNSGVAAIFEKFTTFSDSFE